jgi:hypothetical protein
VVTEWCFELEFVVLASRVGLALWRVWAWPRGVLWFSPGFPVIKWAPSS